MVAAFKVQWGLKTPAPGPVVLPDFGRNYFGAPSPIFTGAPSQASERFSRLNLPAGYLLVRA